MTTPTLFTSADYCYDSLVLRWLILEKEAPVEIVREEGPHGDIDPPFYVERDLHLFDHWVTLQFLQERYPGEVFMPVDPVTRAQIRHICVLLRESELDLERELCGLLGQYPYIAGDNFTLADIYAGAKLDTMELKTDQANDYRDRLGRRPAMQEAR